MKDIYNPPPAPVPWELPKSEPLAITTSDLLWLIGMFAVMLPIAVAVWAIAPMLGGGTLIGGTFVVLESWFSGLTFLRRHPDARPVGRGFVFLAALAPWLVGIGFTAALMWGLFLMSDMMTG